MSHPVRPSNVTSAGPSMFAGAQIGSITGGVFNNIQIIHTATASTTTTLQETISKLEALTGPSRAPEFLKIHNGIIDDKTQGTGAAFRAKNEVQIWEIGEIEVLWVEGGPGAGKTYMASSFVEWSKERAAEEPPNTTAVIQVYMRYDQKLTDYCVVLAVLDQLIRASRHLPGVVTRVKDTLEEWEASGSKARPPLNQLVGLMKDIVKSFRSVRVIFDGVDELLRDLQFLLIEIFAEVPAQMVFLSRPSELLETAAQEEFARCGRSFAFLELVAADEDLDLFITSSIHRILPLRRVLVNKEKRDGVGKKVKTNARGMFLHAALQLDRLKACRTILAVNKALDEFPAKLEDLYLSTLQRIYDEDDECFAQRLLGWLLHICGSITIKDLQYAVSVSPDAYVLDEDGVLDEGYLLSLTCGLVVVEASTQQVRFVHYSAYQVVLNLLQTRFGLDQPTKHHESIARTCIVRLETCGFKTTDLTTLGDMRRHFTSNPLLEYAYLNTSFHLQHLLPLTDDLRTTVDQFVLECESFPYYPNPEPQHEDSAELFLLAPLHVATLLGVLDLISELITVHQVHVDLRAAHSTGLGYTSVMIAAVEGHEAALDLLLRLGGDATMLSNLGGNALHEPAYNGNVAVVKRLCDVVGTGLNQQDKWGYTPLHWAARQGHTAVAKALLSFLGLDVNLANENGSTALILASLHAHLDVAIALLAVPTIDVNIADKWGQTPLFIASWRGRFDIVKLLLGHPQVQIDRQNEDGSTALIMAVSEGHTDIVRLLLKRTQSNSPLPQASRVLAGDQAHDLPPSTNHLEIDSRALVFAASGGHKETFDLLLDHNETQLNLADEEGNSALSVAALYGHLALVLTLLSLPAVDVNISNKWADTPLIRASWKGHLDVVRALMAHPALDINRQSSVGNTALIIAAREGHVDVVRLLLENAEVQPNLVDEEGNSALSAASMYGHLGVVLALLATPTTDANLPNKWGVTPLHRASWQGHLNIVEALQSHHKVDVNQQCNAGNTPLFLAAREGHADVVRLLLANPKTQPNLVDQDGDSALGMASIYGHLDLVLAFLATPRVDVNTTNKGGHSPLALASWKGHLSLVKAFLDHPAIERSETGSTALILAAREGHASVVDLLVKDAGTHPNLVDDDGDSALNMAALSGHLDVVLALLSCPLVDVNNPNKSADTPLIQASWKGHIDIVKALVACPEVDLNKQNKVGLTALIVAARNGQAEVVRVLLQNPRIQPNLVDQEGCSALTAASLHGHLETVLALLTTPATDVNLANQWGQTPLLCASWKGHAAVVEALLGRCGIDVNRQSNNGNTALTVAARDGHQEIIRLFLNNPDTQLNRVDEDEDSALGMAAMNGHLDIVLALLSNPTIDVNLASKWGTTPLLYALFEGHIEVASALLEHPDIDVNRQSDDGNTALIIGARNGYEDVVRLLLARPDVDIHLVDEDDKTAMDRALEEGHNAIGEALMGHASTQPGDNEAR